MAKEAKVKIGGRDIKNVHSISYGLSATVDQDGGPTRGLVCTGIHLSRIADEATDICNWASGSGETNRNDGEVTFFNEDDKEIKKLTFSNAYVTDYSTSYSTVGEHVLEHFTIMPEQIGVSGDDHDFNWKDK